MVYRPDVSCKELPKILILTVDGVCGVVGLTDEHAALKGGERGLVGGVFELPDVVVEGAVGGLEVLVGDPEFTVLPGFQWWRAVGGSFSFNSGGRSG